MNPRYYTVHRPNGKPFRTLHVTNFDAYIATVRKLGAVVSFASPFDASWVLP